MIKPAFILLDSNLDGSLTKAEFQTAMVLIYKERKSLLKSLIEGENAIGTLNTILTIFMVLMMLLVTLLFMGVEITGLMVTLSSLFVSASFATGKSVERMVDSILFIFFFHPFDIGDRVVINDEVFLVHRMTILSTELIRYDNTKVIYPNSLLLQLPISNFRRSPDQFDLIKLEIEYRTPASKIQIFERRVKQFLIANVEHYYKTFELEIRDSDDLKKIFIRL